MPYDHKSSVRGSGRRAASASNKLEQIGSCLAGRTSNVRNETGSTPSKFDYLSGSELAQRLFSNAPEEFLESKTADQLVTIIERSVACLEQTDRSTGGIVVETGINEEYASFIVALGDRPFIVNTINGCAEQFDCLISAFLHPILSHRGARISLSYLEVTGISRGQYELLAKLLADSLADLTLVTDDFPAMLAVTETLARLYDNSHYKSPLPAVERKEYSDFLRWLSDGAFTFLGYARWRVSDQDGASSHPEQSLGLARSKFSHQSTMLEELFEDVRILAERAQPMFVTKLHTESTVHRRGKLVHIVVEEPSTSGKHNNVHSFIGLLTSKAVSQEASGVPLIRQKLRKLLEVEEVVERSHDYKYIIDIIDRMPKDELLQLEVDELRDIVRTILDIRNKNETRVAVRRDTSQRGVSLLILMPPERFNPYVRQKLQEYLESTFGAVPGSSEYQMAVSNKPPVRFNFYVPIAKGRPRPVNLAEIEGQVAALSRTWKENLEEFSYSDKRFSDPNDLLARYGDSFPEDYQALHSIEECAEDILTMESLSAGTPLSLSYCRSSVSDPHGSFTVIMYSRGAEITISRAFPVLENAGMEVINERSSIVEPLSSPTVYIHRFLVRLRSAVSISADEFQRLVAPGLVEVLLGNADDDALNSLMLNAKLELRCVNLLRAYCRLLWQVNKFAARHVILEAFSQHSQLAAQFWAAFEQRFNPGLAESRELRKQRFEESLRSFRENLREIQNITADRILRGLASLLEYTVRTNFFSSSATIALKLHAERIEIMPNPRPLFEIFVFSRLMEGVHLRTAKVSRGGIRVSDRHEDYRTEVLGLLKTQRVKNALIVPHGAKGGFIMKQQASDAAAAAALTVAAYKDYIRALLSLTDNRSADRIVRPDKLVVYDGEDPYLVVAADKGTATFSDIANKIAVEEFNFWLGDAFASGGSRGYDHKGFGITARGAWEAARRHFDDSGVQYRTEPFTAVGIGDMSGDVFGNGMILDFPIKLIGAFNHKHVFIDPNPDPHISLQERRRLFAKPRSEWKDYDPALISPGGGVFGRFDRQIKLTLEMRSALKIADDAADTADGEELVLHILRAKCDLLWSGGIGTYVKARDESNSDVNDGTNDRVRINADELRARVVAEGGNLGFTQQARIDFSRRGGLINTDAIDNSGGVDLSDHEVNIKILFAEAALRGHLAPIERDDLLQQLAPEVVQAVLEHNRNQALALAVASRRSRGHIEYFSTLIRDIAKMGYVDRALEHLPDDDEIADRAAKKQGLTRPELAVCLAAVKMWLKDVIRSSGLIDDPLLKTFLLEYFPATLHKRFDNDITLHTLSAHIIASEVTNRLIDTLGITFIHRTCTIYSVPTMTVVRSAIASKDLFGVRAIRGALGSCIDTLDSKSLFNLKSELGRAMQEATSWFVRYHPQATSVKYLAELYRDAYNKLLAHMDEWLIGEEREFYLIRFEKFLSNGFSERIARTLAIFPRIITVLEILWTAAASDKDVRQVALIYAHTMEELRINQILKLEGIIETTNKWEQELRINCYEEIRRNTSLIVLQLLERDVSHGVDVISLLRNTPSYQHVTGTIQEVTQKFPGIAALSAIAKQLKIYQVRPPDFR